MNTSNKLEVSPRQAYEMYALLNELEEYFKENEPHGELHTKISDLLNDVDTLPADVETECEAKRVIDYLMSVLGGGFHPDTPIADYINLSTHKQTFTDTEISRLQPLLDHCFDVMGDEVYDYAMEVYCSNEATNLNND